MAEQPSLAMNQSTGVDWEGQEKEGGRVMCASQVSLFLFSTEVQGLTSKFLQSSLCPEQPLSTTPHPQDITVI